ncbi:hypothetical protein CMI42_03265 [Candidatus Pacearchaeota archaeon]|nr:hypothetical protein [Candidatus Pacearchaeota archaeon]|tara:strand:+ start:786 stop:1205 length:420 start_codon:yes stop_codon:yes gene_type:complete
MDKKHSDCQKLNKRKLEEKGYRCKSEFIIPSKDFSVLSKLDLACFGKDKSPKAVACEFDTNLNLNNPQHRKNSEDLQHFSDIFGSSSRTFHTGTDNCDIDFDKELPKEKVVTSKILSPQKRIYPRQIIGRRQKREGFWR